MAHTAALEAWAEIKAETNDMAVIKARQGDLVWSAAGHGFGGMVMQVAALDLKSRGFLFSAHSFGSAPVFNQAAARRWDDLFEGSLILFLSASIRVHTTSRLMASSVLCL